jgi:hypothetical protein
MRDIQDLERLSRRAAGLHLLLEEAQHARPERAEGADRSGALLVTLGPDGLPRSFRVAADWAQKLQASSFGAAVNEACLAASQAWQAAWSRALATSRGRAAVPGPEHPPQAWRLPAEERRPPQILAEDVLAAADEVLALAGTAAGQRAIPQGTGANRSKTVAITLSREAVLHCDADPDWIAGKPAALLTEALNQALEGAREDLAAAVRSAISVADAARGKLDALMAEAVAALSDPGRPAIE